MSDKPTHDPDTGEDLECMMLGCDTEIVYEDDEVIQTACRRCGGEYMQDKEPTQ